MYGHGPSEGPVDATIFMPEEQATYRRCETFLWGVRCHLHFLAGRAEERLTFDVQQAMADRLGYVDRGGLRAVERFMKHYFLVAKDVGDLTTILCSALEMEQVKASPGLGRLLNPTAHPYDQRFPHRQRPAQRGRCGRVQARPRQPHPLLCESRGNGRLFPPKCRAPAAPLAAPDRRQPAQRQGGEPDIP
jgi:UTP:GlnB (protein PII) uridylyltransferase